MHRKIWEVTDIHFTLLDAVGISRSPAVHQNAKTKKKTNSSVLFRKRQYQKCDSSCIQTPAQQKHFWTLIDYRRWSHLLDSEIKLVVWICHTLTKWRRRKIGLRWLPVQQQLFPRTKDQKWMKLKDSIGTVPATVVPITKRNPSRKI